MVEALTVAAVPGFDEQPAPSSAPANPAGLELEAGITPKAKRSYAAVAGVALGGYVTYADVQALAIYKGGGALPTHNRGGRGLRRTERDAGATGRPGGLWRLG